MRQARWTNEEIKMLQILGAIIGGVVGLTLGVLSRTVVVADTFPWRFVVLTTGAVGAIIGAFNRAPVNSCGGALVLGAVVGAFVGAVMGLVLGGLYWFTLWKPITNALGQSLSRAISGAGLGIITGAIVIDPRTWHEFWSSLRQ
jgi:hypothetical protein